MLRSLGGCLLSVFTTRSSEIWPDANSRPAIVFYDSWFCLGGAHCGDGGEDDGGGETLDVGVFYADAVLY